MTRNSEITENASVKDILILIDKLIVAIDRSSRVYKCH